METLDDDCYLPYNGMNKEYTDILKHFDDEHNWTLTKNKKKPKTDIIMVSKFKLTDDQREYLYKIRDRLLKIEGSDEVPTSYYNISTSTHISRVIQDGHYSDSDRSWMNELHLHFQYI